MKSLPIYTFPNIKNFCGGGFQDWLEVMLEPSCNGRCSFCIEKDGARPINKVSWTKMVDAILY